MNSMIHHAPVLAFILAPLLLQPAAAQRGKPTFRWKGGRIAMDHGAPKFGKHGIHELPPGGEWRLGSNTATTFSTDVPLLAGSHFVAPGDYRAKIYRAQDGKRYYVKIDYGGWALANGREPAYMPGELAVAKSKDKLSVSLTKSDRESISIVSASATKSSARSGDRATRFGGESTTASALESGSVALGESNRSVDMVVRWGPHRVDVPFFAFGAENGPKVRGYKLSSYAIPAALLERRIARKQMTVVASLRPSRKPSGRKVPQFFNLVLGEGQAKLVPAMRAPQDSFGFEQLEPWGSHWTTTTQMTWADGGGEASASAHFRITNAKVAGKTLELTCRAGGKTAALEIPLPKKPRR